MQQKNILTYVKSSIIISLAASIIFLLTTPPQSYILFSLFFLLTATITLTVLGKTVTRKIHLKGSIKLHFLLILACTTLLILQLEGIYIEAVNVILYVIAFIFAPGFFLSNILKFKPSFSRIEFVSLAYPISIALLAIFGTVALILPSNLRGVFALSLIIFLSIISLYSVRADKQTKLGQNSGFVISNPVLILLVILLIFTYFFIILYPQFSSMLGLDITRNFLYALGSTQDVLGNFYYPNTMYPLFSIYQSVMIYVVRPSVGLFQTASVLLNFLGILTFYTMAKQYLKQYDDYLPALATLIWALFAGLGWLSFLSLRMSNPSATAISLIGQANVLSYGDITWRRLFFCLSMETSLVLVFAVLCFLKRTDLPRTQQILFMTILLTPLSLMHQYAIYFLLPFLICLTIFQPAELRKQAKYTACSLTIAAFVSLLLNYVLSIQIAAISIGYIPFLGYLLTSLAIIAILSLRTITPKTLKVSVEKILNSKCTFLVAVVVLLLCVASLLLWFSGNLTFNFGDLNRLGYVPWFLYPVKFGLTSILGIIAIIVSLRNPTYRSRELGVMLASVLMLILASRLMATLQMQYVSTFTFDPNSWLSESIRQIILSFREERMFELFKIPLAIVASIALGKYVITKTKQKNIRLSNYVAVSGFISFILISGMASTFLGFEYYTNQTQTNPLSASELNIINNMQNNIYTNGKAIIITPQTPISYLDFTGATAIVTESPAAWKSKSPELPLFVTRYSKTTPTYVYLHKIRDYQKISDYSGNYLEHLSNTVQTHLENQEVQIKAINNWSIPTPQSSTALVIPYDESKMTIFKPFYQDAYKQYTVLALSFEENMQLMNFYNDPIIYNNVEINRTATFNGLNSYIRINGTNTNFSKILIEFELQPLNLTRNQAIISKFDWGTLPQKSWEIAQYGKRIAFKISPDGNREEVLQTGEILALNTLYRVRVEYDGASMRIFFNDIMVASEPYQEGIFKSNTDIIIGAELFNNRPIAFTNMILRYVQVLNNIPPAMEPIFYAYDFLSSTGLNYTTILSNDDMVNNYQTLILPYDDLITHRILTELEAGLQTTNPRYVLILNTNGYGPLLNLFGNISSQTIAADGISTNEYLTIHPSIEVPIIQLGNNTDTEIQYVNNGLSSPLIMTTMRNQITLVYINIYPLIWQNQLLNSTLLQTLIETLNNYIELYNETTVTSWFTESSLLFTMLEANGTVSIRSSSIASIKLPENQTLNLKEVNTILIHSSRIRVQKGYGFYTTIIASNPSITLQGNQTTSMNINGDATFLIRQPEISVNGKILFEDFYMLHPPTIYTDGRNATLSGNITLNIYVSDEYTIALPYRLNSPITVKYEKPLMEFDEKASFMLLLPYIILIMIFATPILLIQQSKPVNAQYNPKSKKGYE